MRSSTWDTQNKILQELLRNLRAKSGFTQLELAVLLDRPQSYVSKYESGERRLDLLEIRNICICCGVDLPKFVQLLETNITK